MFTCYIYIHHGSCPLPHPPFMCKTLRAMCCPSHWKYALRKLWIVIVGNRGGEWGRQIGSMTEESQVSGCYNITFIYTNQETVSALPWIRRIGAQAATQTKRRPASAGTLGENWGKEEAAFGWVLLYVDRNRGLIKDGSPGRPPRLSHSSCALTQRAQRASFNTSDN